MKFILGKKQHMMQCFDTDGTVIPATVISAGPLVVTQVKTPDTDGYTAVQVAFEDQKASRATKAHLGHVKPVSKDGAESAFKHLREFRDIEEIAVGDRITVDAFAKGDVVTVTGLSKGKGFQGVVKRHGFGGGPRSHGQKHSEREPGSIGGGLRNKVPKGMRMAGRMGGDRITIKNLEVIGVDLENNQILVKGAIPGRRGSLVEIIG
ncbi:MAG: 50S ribosomal protein L3 [Candidatus Pacebacteria bacterium]|jgi:large subunit ribosomal protein L3|nr:50S ribosomal protein L3 [Candidatus Paceibacterota bacterium]